MSNSDFLKRLILVTACAWILIWKGSNMKINHYHHTDNMKIEHEISSKSFAGIKIDMHHSMKQDSNSLRIDQQVHIKEKYDK